MEWLMLMLKLQFFGQLMWRTDSLEKILMLEKIEGRGEGDNRGWDGWMASPTQWTWVWVDSELMMDREAWCAQFMGLQTVRHDWATELNWTEFKLPTTQYLKCPRQNPKLHTTERRKYDVFLKKKINKKIMQ